MQRKRQLRRARSLGRLVHNDRRAREDAVEDLDCHLIETIAIIEGVHEHEHGGEAINHHGPAAKERAWRNGPRAKPVGLPQEHHQHRQVLRFGSGCEWLKERIQVVTYPEEGAQGGEHRLSSAETKAIT